MKIIYEPSGRAKEYCNLAVNLYKGCSHACSYCYAPSATFTSREDFINDVKPRKNIIDKLKVDANKERGEGKPVLLSFTSDPYQKLDEKLQLTRQAIKILKDAGYTIVILTKAGSLPKRDFDLLSETDHYGTSLTFDNIEDTKEWEPNSGTPEQRKRLLQKAHKQGIETWVSLEPVIKPEQSLRLIDETKDYVDLFKVGKLNHHKKAKQIDWEKFGNKAIKKLKKYDKPYYVKKDLREYIF